jgi:hypothetical protein
MRILARVFDSNEIECARVWLNGASEVEDPLCALSGCQEPLGWTYPYCDQHLRKMFGVQVDKSEVHGMGLFAARDFEPGEPVVPFGGELVRSQKQLNSRYSAEGDPECTAIYAVKVGGKYVDALRLRHAWVYANHSAKPNVEMRKTGLYALKRVREGAELRVDYGPDFDFERAGRVTYFILP